MPIDNAYTDVQTYLAGSVPEYLLSKIKKFHTDPFAWWNGQLFLYLMRFSVNFKKVVAQVRKEIEFEDCCVG